MAANNLYEVLELFQDGSDTGDNTWDWMCYVDYIPEDAARDNYDIFLIALSKNVKPLRVDRDYVLCDYTRFLEDHWEAFKKFTQEYNNEMYALQDDDVLDDEDVFDIAFGTLGSLINGGYSQNEYRAFVNDVLGYTKLESKSYYTEDLNEFGGKEPENYLEYNAYGNVYKITFELERYLDNGTLAIQMINWSEGYEEPFALLTVNLDASDMLPDNAQFVDVNNLDNIVNWIVDNNIGDTMDYTVDSGFVSYPAISFNMDVLKKYCTGGSAL